MKKIDVNVDIGEGQPFDADLLRFATSANVCCGAHAGSLELTAATIELCRGAGVRIGMHPGFPDPVSLGRRIPMRDEVDFCLDSLVRQAQAFASLIQPRYVKPHGAWYTLVHPPFDGAIDPTAARGFRATLAAIVFQHKIPAMLMPSGGDYLALGPQWVIREGFADRGYAPKGGLLPRSALGGILSDPSQIAAQVLKLAPDVDSLCVHGDTPGCVGIAELVVRTLRDAGYEVGA